jgi:outer membrane protein OmpA-like peptidoglycan-associated protein
VPALTEDVMNIRIALMLALSLTIAGGAAAADVKGAADHPLIKRYEGSTIVQYEAKNYDKLMIPTGKVEFVSGNWAFPKRADVEGQITRIQYKAPMGRTSLEVFRNYESALKAAGFQVLFSCTTTQCGDSDVFAQNLFGVTSPPLTLNQKTQNYLAAKLTRANGDAWVRLFAVENHEWPGKNDTQEGQVVVELDIAETKSMQGGMVTVNADGMRRAILETGRVALYGIYFDTAKADVKPESKGALDEIAKLLKSDAKMRLLVVGHTDNVGSIESNRDLSERRAKAVVQKLITDYSIAANRLTPAGVGFAAPTSTNRSDEGKAKNRRVELVEY